MTLSCVSGDPVRFSTIDGWIKCGPVYISNMNRGPPLVNTFKVSLLCLCVLLIIVGPFIKQVLMCEDFQVVGNAS